MFGRKYEPASPVIIDRAVPYAKTVTVHEHRAPTDQSVDLLSEMEAKAREKIIATLPIKSTLIDGAVIAELTAYGQRYHLTAITKFNGKEIRVTAELDAYPMEAEGPHAVVLTCLQALTEALAKEVAKEVLIIPLADALGWRLKTLPSR